MRWAAVLAGVGLVAAAVPATAHHSIAAMYDRAKTVELEGRLTKADFVNPHALFELEVRDPAGAVAVWQLESRGVQGMTRVGLDGKAVARGDRIKVKGNPAHSGQNNLWLSSLETADGKAFDLSFRR